MWRQVMNTDEAWGRCSLVVDGVLTGWSPMNESTSSGRHLASIRRSLSEFEQKKTETKIGLTKIND